MDSIPEKQYNYFYKTTNLLNGKFYYGIHSTNNLNDGYLGSGKALKQAIKKHGKINFSFEIILNFPTRKEASDYEHKIVTKDLVENTMCYNVKIGGDSLFEYTDEHRNKLKIASKKRKSPANTIKCSINGIIYNMIKEAAVAFGISANTVRIRLQSTDEKWATWMYIDTPYKMPEHVVENLRKTNTGRKMSDETKKKISIATKTRLETDLDNRNRLGNLAKGGGLITDQLREKMRNNNKNKKLSEDTKRKISESGKGRVHSEESKNKMSDIAKNQPHLQAGRKLKDETVAKLKIINSKFNKPCMVLGIQYDSVQQVCDILNLHRNVVRYRLINTKPVWKQWYYITQENI